MWNDLAINHLQLTGGRHSVGSGSQVVVSLSKVVS